MNTNHEGEMTAPVKVYEFRKLQATDVFPMFQILSKIGINQFADVFGNENIKDAMSKADSADFRSVGITAVLGIAQIVLTNLPRCENEIFQMLSDVSNLSVDEVKGLDFATFTEMVIDFVKKDEFADFIKVVSKLFK